jgi:hypothetical protein
LACAEWLSRNIESIDTTKTRKSNFRDGDKKSEFCEAREGRKALGYVSKQSGTYRTNGPSDDYKSSRLLNYTLTVARGWKDSKQGWQTGTCVSEAPGAVAPRALLGTE